MPTALCQFGSAVAPATRAQRYSLCKPVNILFTIPTIIIHYLSPNPVALKISAAPEVPRKHSEGAHQVMESQQQCNVTHIASAHRHPDGQGEQLPALGVPLLLHSSRQQPVLQSDTL